ncbi:TlpA family protein disulfide reductase [bacterium]|nr:TlpA family protein disulfide reductase [bacterium]
MIKKTLFCVSLLLFVTCGSRNVVCTFEGMLIGHDGQPMKKSNIQLLSNEPIMPSRISKTFNINDNGSFSIPISSAGFYKIRFCGVNHQSFEQMIFFKADNDIKLNVKLKPIEMKAEIESLKITGDFNDFSSRRNTVVMNRQDDNVFIASLDVSSDTLAYQIVGADKSLHTINGQQADHFVLDSGGDYISVLNTKGLSEVTIKYDLSLMINSKSEVRIDFDESNRVQNDITTILTDIESRRNIMIASYREYTRNGGDRSKFEFDWSKDLSELNELWKNEKNKDLKEIRYLVKHMIGEIDSTEAVKVLENIPPTSPLWSINTNVLNGMIYKTKQEIDYLDYLTQLLKNHPDSTIKPKFYQTIMSIAQNNGKNEILNSFYYEFVEKYPDHYSIKNVKSQYSPERNIQVGKQIPGFTFISIDDSTKHVSNKTLLGTIYMLDFWATWCGPCIGEMKSLHEAFEKYNGYGFELISVSLDRSVDKLIEFREAKWKMPWFNSHMKFSDDNELIKEFELTSIPKPILVDKDGKIIFIGSDIRGGKLDQTLSTLF